MRMKSRESRERIGDLHSEKRRKKRTSMVCYVPPIIRFLRGGVRSDGLPIIAIVPHAAIVVAAVLLAAAELGLPDADGLAVARATVATAQIDPPAVPARGGVAGVGQVMGVRLGV